LFNIFNNFFFTHLIPFFYISYFTIFWNKFLFNFGSFFEGHYNLKEENNKKLVIIKKLIHKRRYKEVIGIINEE
jgi:hypothetical protein